MNAFLARFSELKSHIHIGGMNPGRDWRLLLTVFIVLLLGIVGWNVLAFHTIVAGGAPRESGGEEASSDASVLQTMPALLDKRAAEDARYINGVYRFADPSQ